MAGRGKKLSHTATAAVDYCATPTENIQLLLWLRSRAQTPVHIVISLWFDTLYATARLQIDIS